MNIADILRIKTTISMTELKRNPRAVIQTAEAPPVAVLSHGKLKLYVLSAKTYETLLEWIDDASLIKTVKARRSSKAIKVDLKDL